MTSSNKNILRVTGHLCGEFTGRRWIPHKKASDAELWCFFDLRLNERLSKQWWGWWFETPSLPLWRHSNGHPVRWLTAALVTTFNTTSDEGRTFDFIVAVQTFITEYTSWAWVNLPPCRMHMKFPYENKKGHLDLWIRSHVWSLGPFYQHGFTLIPTWRNNHMHSKVWHEIIYSLPNVIGTIVTLWEWISNSIQHFIMHVITYPYWD